MVGLWGSLGAQQFSESVVPLQDPQVNAWYVFGDVVVAIDYRGRGKVTAYINAYSLSTQTFLWRHEIRVQEDGDASGRYSLPVYDQNLLYLGNGPLTVLDVATGRTPWTIACDKIGSINLGTAELQPDGALLLGGSKGCGDDREKRVQLIDARTGAVRWSVVAQALEYKNGNMKHEEFAWRAMRDAGGRIERVVLIGERLSAVSFADGRVLWEAKGDVGRFVGERGGVFVFAHDDKLTAYRGVDGTVAWSIKTGAPWANIQDIPGTSDVIYTTYYAAYRVDPTTGAVRWTAKRSQENWSRVLNPPFFYMRTADNRWGAYDLTTGAKRWDFTPDWGGNSFPDTMMGTGGVNVVMVAYAKWDRDAQDEVAPYVLWGVDATTGAIRWRLDKANGHAFAGYEPIGDNTVAVQEEATLQWNTVNVTDGSLTAFASSAATQRGCNVTYFRKDKSLACVGPSGARVWSRPGPQSDRRRHILNAERGWVVWSARDGTVEIIRMTDGMSLYKTMADRNPAPTTAGGGRYLLVPSGKTLKIITTE
jgi:hypothetical protein